MSEDCFPIELATNELTNEELGCFIKLTNVHRRDNGLPESSELCAEICGFHDYANRPDWFDNFLRYLFPNQADGMRINVMIAEMGRDSN